MIEFKQAAVAMCSSISQLVNSAYRGEGAKQGWTTESDLLAGQRTDPDKILEMIQDPSSVILTAWNGDTLVGCVFLQNQGTDAYLGMLTVSPGGQAKGLGKELLNASEKYILENWGHSRIRMTVITLRTELLSWYERRGYRRTGVFEPFPYGDARFGIPLRPDLQFEVLTKDL